MLRLDEGDKQMTENILIAVGGWVLGVIIIAVSMPEPKYDKPRIYVTTWVWVAFWIGICGKWVF